MSAEAAERLATFRSRREEAAKSPQGFLSLVNTQWVTEPTTVWAAKGTWAPCADGGSGLLVSASAEEGIIVDGVVVDGEAIARGKDDESPSSIVFSDTCTGTVIVGAEGYALRVFDQNSDDNQNFSHVDAYQWPCAFKHFIKRPANDAVEINKKGPST